MPITDKFSEYAIRRAWLATVGFFIWGSIVFVFTAIQWPSSLPLAFFYILMLINTFFSIRVFASITPRRNIEQQFFDIVLGVCLLLMPLFLSRPIFFVLVTTFLFIMATLKYIFLVPLSGHSKLMHRKIRIDTLGILLCFMTLIGILAGYTYISSLFLVGVFLVANVYVLWYRPLYDLTQHGE